ncbi:MAG: BadF/BadG/BcrA/BcrD ATPase family protein [Bacilli bacterium]|nr:BadF/BadG/BcrA/BcrD ATPase family protein [Bacilli bacterium]
MKKYLVVDSGGTKSVAAVFDETGRILGSGTAGGGNAGLSSYKIALGNVLKACNLALDEANVFASEIEYCNLFIPGFYECLEEFIEIIRIKSKIMHESDELKFSAFKDEDGIVVLAGTGSFATAYIGSNRYTVGGWGTLMGDEGSGYHVGVMALRECARNYDDNKKTLLLEQVMKYFEVEDFIILRRAIYKENNQREKAASLCPLVCQLAAGGDQASKKIVEEATRELANLAYRAYMKSSTNRRLPVVLTGGLHKAGSIVVDLFNKKIVEISKGQLYYIENKLDVIYGAILKTLYDEGIDIDKITFEV